mmetsp:Transcript_96307/g.267631  ORF Transcript_96307/g.267631 Transcript_96307/m.267631 type:complete len:379 (+) Transcript_96307:62-1198(+)
MSSAGVPLSDGGYVARQSSTRIVDTPSQDRANRERGLAQKYSNAGQITTLMLRNIPSMYTQDMLLEEIIDCMGSSDSFDFFYLPWDLQNDCNVGYAFVNFRDAASAERCSRIFTNFSFRKFDSRKTCRVQPAHIQGLENNLRHLMDRAVSEAHSHYPIIMWKGEKLKLGKVIAALDGQRVNQPPKSAPGKSLSDLNRDLGFAPSWPPHAPPFHQSDMLQSMPELRAALNNQVHESQHHMGHTAFRDPVPLHNPCLERGMQVNPSPGHVAMPASMPGRMPGASQGPPGLRPGRAPAPGFSLPQAPPMGEGAWATGPASAGAPRAPPPGWEEPGTCPGPAPAMASASPEPSGSAMPTAPTLGVRDPDKDVFEKFFNKFAA